jgi:hypothetical protein
VIDVDETRVGEAALPVRSLVKTLDFQPAMPLLLSSVTHLSEADFEKVVRWLLVFVVRYSIVMDLDPSGMESILYKLARDIRSKADNAQACLAHVKKTRISLVNLPVDGGSSVPGGTQRPRDARDVVKRYGPVTTVAFSHICFS